MSCYVIYDNYVFDSRYYFDEEVSKFKFTFHLTLSAEELKDHLGDINPWPNQTDSEAHDESWTTIHVYAHPCFDHIPHEPLAHYGDENLGFVWMVDDFSNQFDVFCKAHRDRRRGRCSDEECTSLGAVDGLQRDGSIKAHLQVWDGNELMIKLISLVRQFGKTRPRQLSDEMKAAICFGAEEMALRPNGQLYNQAQDHFKDAAELLSGSRE